jgi:hypothetical protein
MTRRRATRHSDAAPRIGGAGEGGLGHRSGRRAGTSTGVKTQLFQTGAGDSVECFLKSGTTTLDQAAMKTLPALASVPASMQAVACGVPKPDFGRQRPWGAYPRLACRHRPEGAGLPDLLDLIEGGSSFDPVERGEGACTNDARQERCGPKPSPGGWRRIRRRHPSTQGVGRPSRHRVVLHRKVLPFGAGPELFEQRPDRFQVVATLAPIGSESSANRRRSSPIQGNRHAYRH